MLRKVDYSFRWDAKGRPVVVIDLHDGFPEECTEESLVSVIETIYEKRREHKSEAEFRNLVLLFNNALEYLRLQMDLEQR